MQIRPYRDGDQSALYRVCLRTGDSGADATALYTDPDLLGHVYTGPYLALEPELALVLADDADEPVGYTLGAADTRDFERRCEESWWPPLRKRYPLPPPPDWPGNARDRALVETIHHPYRADDRLLERYPAHLHIDMEERAQGHGNGRRLIQQLFGLLAARGAPGVHLGVGARNARAIGFYEHLGFTAVYGDDDVKWMVHDL